MSDGQTVQKKCTEGEDVTFSCSCPDGFNGCKFKKLFQGGTILRNGALGAEFKEKFRLDENNSDIIMKGCKKVDEGDYIAMCGGSDTNFQTSLAVILATSESLQCMSGGEISFACPCCPERIDSSRFENKKGDAIVQNGEVNNRHPKFKLNQNKTSVILKDCTEDDSGTYLWLCDDHKHSLSLNVTKETVVQTGGCSKKTSIPIEMLSLLNVLLQYLLMN